MINIELLEVAGVGPAMHGMRNPMNAWHKNDTHKCEMSDKCSKCPILDICNTPGDLMPKREIIGPNDMDRALKLAKGGPVHAKYRRFIGVWLNITAPLYWWKEFDTYKVGTAANSCSTMHKIMEKEFDLEDFSYEHLADEKHEYALMGEEFDYGEQVLQLDRDSIEYCTDRYGCCIEDSSTEGFAEYPLDILETIIESLNRCREMYLRYKTRPLKDNSKREAILKHYWWQIIQLLPSSYNQKRTVFVTYEVLANIVKWRSDHKQDEWKTFCKFLDTLPYPELFKTDYESEKIKELEAEIEQLKHKLETTMRQIAT